MSATMTATPTATSPAPTLISVRDLSAGYGGVPVVRGLNLHVKRGEVVALLGPNGAGKTTTLLTISGILRPVAGSIEVFGVPVVGGRPHKVARSGLAHVAEDRSLFFDLTVAENLKLGLTGARAHQRVAMERCAILHSRRKKPPCPCDRGNCSF